MIAFLTGISNDFDVALAETLSSNGYTVYAGNAGRACCATDFAQIIKFDPDNEASINHACEALLQSPGHIDLYIDTSNYTSPGDNFTVFDDVDYDVMESVYRANVLRPIALYEVFQPLVHKGEMKRYCYITSATASTNLTTATTGYAYNMAKAALHNFLQIIKNRWLPEGFTFRAFDPCTDKLPADAAAKSAFFYFTRRRGVEGGRDDEDRLAIRDAFGRQQSW